MRSDMTGDGNICKDVVQGEHVTLCDGMADTSNTS